MLWILISMLGFSISHLKRKYNFKNGKGLLVGPFLKGAYMAKKKKITPEVPEQVYIYDGENLPELARKITGSSWKMWALLAYSGISLHKLKKGDVLKWRL